MIVPAAGRKKSPAKNEGKSAAQRKAKVPGSGRKKGSLNKVTAEIKGLAQQHGADAIQTLARLMKAADSDTARIAAARELLDRGYGKPRQAIEHTGNDGGPITLLETVIVDPQHGEGSS